MAESKHEQDWRKQRVKGRESQSVSEPREIIVESANSSLVYHQ